MGQPGNSHHEGELGKTPFAHLLVYALDRQLTGEMFFGTAPNETIVRFARGVPVKIKAGDRYSLLGRMLVDIGAIPEQTLDDALATRGLLGDVLMLAGRIERNVLEATADKQFVMRIVHLFEFPPATPFRYVDGSVELLTWGGEPQTSDPIRLLACGVRAHGSPALAAALASIRAPLRLHPAAPLARFDFDADEQLLVDHLRSNASTVDELVAFDLLPRVAVERLAYLLLITRAFAAEGSSVTPLGAELGVDSSQRTPQSGRPVAKVQLLSTAYRSGAAVPDLPGDGERAAISRRRRKAEAAGGTPVTPLPAIEPGRARVRDAAEKPERPPSGDLGALDPARFAPRALQPRAAASATEDEEAAVTIPAGARAPKPKASSPTFEDAATTIVDAAEGAPPRLRGRPAEPFDSNRTRRRTPEELDELHQIAAESTPLSTPEELIPTQAIPRSGMRGERSSPGAARERSSRGRSGIDLLREASGGPAPPSVEEAQRSVHNMTRLAAPSRASGAQTLLSPVDDRPTPVPPSAVTLCALAREKVEARDVAGAFDAAKHALRADPKNEEALALVAWIHSMMTGAEPRR